MIESMFVYLCEVCIDVLINKSLMKKFPKHVRYFCFSTLIVIILLYFLIFFICANIAIESFSKNDFSSGFKFFITCLALLLIFVLYGRHIYGIIKNK